MAETVPVLGTSQDPDKQQRETVVPPHSMTKLVILVPKKRPHHLPPVTQAEREVTRVIRYFPTQSKGGEAIPAVLTDPLPDNSGVIGNKLPQHQFVKPDKPSVKSVSRAVKKQHQVASTSKLPSPKASTPVVAATKLPTPLASTSKAPTSRASTSKASTSKSPSSKASTPEVPVSKLPTPLASTSKASTSKALPSKPSTSRKPAVLKETSKARVSVSTSAGSGDDEASFWLRTAKTKFGSNEFREYLREANFTERQAESLQNVLHNMMQKMNNAINNSDRLVKTHKCNNCEFTICHQCVCLFFLRAPIPIDDPPAVIEVQKTVICTCNFAFFHMHDVDLSSSEGVNTASVERKSNIATIRCSACDMIVLIEHPPEQKVENTLIQWSAVESDNQQEFHASITAHLRRLSVPPLTLGEMFMCTKKCCLLFHRCIE